MYLYFSNDIVSKHSEDIKRGYDDIYVNIFGSMGVMVQTKFG